MVYIGYNLLGQANSSNTTTVAELYFMWCVTQKRKVHIGFWVAYTCHVIATHPARNLNICNLLGAFVTNSMIINLAPGTSATPIWKMPTLFDISFFIKTKMMYMRDGEPRFYRVGQATIPSEKVVDDSGNRSKLDGNWKKKIETVVHGWTQVNNAQKGILERHNEQLDKAVEMMEKLMSQVQET